MSAFYSVRIDDIPHDGFRLATQWSAGELAGILSDTDGLFRIDSPIELEVQFHLSGKQIIMEGTCTVGLELVCVRCLKEFSRPLEARFRYIFWPKSKEVQQVEERELSAEELEVLYYKEGEPVDLRPLIAEQIYLHAPQYAYCQDSCKGLCAHCGADLNEQACSCSEAFRSETLSPFSVLKKLKK
jgi:uncharacterized protein